jgi:predicted nucleic acid-binding Zn ribbon protein
MPIYEYRCDCGEVLEALVRGGREPADARDLGHFCDTDGRLKKLISAHNVGHGGGSAYRVSESAACEVPSSGGCGHCGTPQACTYD